jgi:hypothetical protein
MTPQSTFLIAAPIAAGQEQALRDILQDMNDLPGQANPRNSLVPFHQFPTLHVARFTILEANTNEDIREHGVEPRPWTHMLVFMGDVDGDPLLFLAELCVRAGDGLRLIFAHCQGFDSSARDLLQWLHRHNRRPTANYVNWRGRTVVQVHEERALADFVRDWLAGADPQLEPQQLHRQLREAVQEEVAALRLRLSPEAPTPAGWWLANAAHLAAIPLLGLLLLPLVVIGAPLYLWYLRRLEESDPENTRRPGRDHLQALVEVEDLGATNHFNVFGQVKPGRFRRYTIRALLLLLDYAARHIYGRGYLTRIQTIHFARWVLMDGGSRVYFASNYDGSADTYMDDFINKVAWGLNLVFSNGVGYPRTRFLVKGGAEFEQKYKHTLRRNQLPSCCWYKAYPGLTAVDLARHHRIRRVLDKAHPDKRELREWIAML